MGRSGVAISTTCSRPADLGNRFVARLVDGLAVGLIAIPLIASGRQPVAGGGTSMAVATLGFVYAAGLDATGGTLGKRLLRLSLMGPGGRRPGLGAGATRNLWLLASLLPGLAGQSVAVAVSVALAITIAKHPGGLGWHDRLAGTAVRRPA